MSISHCNPAETPTSVGRRTWLDALTRESALAYHARAAECLGSHRLATFRECPLLYHLQQTGQVADEDRPAYLIGRAAHSLILEGPDVFAGEYAVGGPINPRTGAAFGSGTKAFAEWAEQQGKPVLTDDQAALVRCMAAGVASHPLAATILSAGIAEGVARCDYQGVASQVRIDWASPTHGIVDLKTADNLTWFEVEARRFGYLHQLAFYRAVIRLVTGQTPPVHLIAVEKREPYRCGVWLVSPDALAAAQRENEAAIGRLRRCREDDCWPSGYEELRLLEFA